MIKKNIGKSMAKSQEAPYLVEEVPGNLLDSNRVRMDVVSYAGHIHVPQDELAKIGVDVHYDSYLFYWFFESRNTNYVQDPGKIPIVIWLNGGPGGSSTAGLLLENGPIHMEINDTAAIVNNPQGWNEHFHVLYWDNPIGTGYSFSKPSGYYAKCEIELSGQFYLALQGFYGMYPQYRGNPLYITGESYAGKYIPNMVKTIDKQNEKVKKEARINLEGFAIGDGWMRPELHLKNTMDYAHNIGFIDTPQYKKIDKVYTNFQGIMNDAKKAKEAGNIDEYNKLMTRAFYLGGDINTMVLNCAGHPDEYDVRRWGGLPLDALAEYMNMPRVKEALNVPDDEDIRWECADNAGPVTVGLITDNMADVTPKLYSLIEAKDGKGNPKYRVMHYTGDFDMACGFMGTETILNELNLDGAWANVCRRVWVIPPEKTLGYVKSHANLTQVNIVDSGHLVPMDRPAVSRMMIDTWVPGKDFPSYDPMPEE